MFPDQEQNTSTAGKYEILATSSIPTFLTEEANPGRQPLIPWASEFFKKVWGKLAYLTFLVGGKHWIYCSTKTHHGKEVIL